MSNSTTTTQTTTVNGVTTTTVTTVTTTVGAKEIYDFFVLDRSGSMETIRDATIAGFNEYLNKSKQSASVDGVKAFTSVLLFDDEFILLNDFTPTQEVNPLDRKTFVPRNSTALNDATAKAIQILQNRLNGREKADNVDVTITVMTDGWENASKEFRGVGNQALKALIQKVRDEYKWTVNYVGAGDPTTVRNVASTLGVDLSNVRDYTCDLESTKSAFADMGAARAYKSASFATKGIKSNVGYFSAPTEEVQPQVDHKFVGDSDHEK